MTTVMKRKIQEKENNGRWHKVPPAAEASTVTTTTIF